ncbi:hypothetical protein I6N95_16815 [Vagococcus sp. BWB3-3]|uniref:Lipoprotein n=1 Tax=Vagococcus allomyrinae TaxID=2794353 RepID=A0A940P7V7_9ENTE|nr:hypothetical protein [Vagococcus allomyrinae]MBP1042680.1 hypothetical protein [Vagococcus allomyrinae]
MLRKKVQTIVLLSTVALFLFTGCGKTESKDDGLITSSSHEKEASFKTSTSETSIDIPISSSTEKTNESSVTFVAQRTYTFEEQLEISDKFLTWASERAAMGGMAVNGAYFNHGASGRGDWYAKTPEGQYILMQRQDPTINIEKNKYLANAIGGVVFYYSKFGTTGVTNEINDQENNPSTATGFSQVAILDQPIVKYLLTDNGFVYEFKSNGAFSDGFYVTDDDGDFDYWPGEQVPFIVSEDKVAQDELQRILASYN